METFSALLALYVGNSPVPGEFPAQRPVMRSFDVFFDLRPNKRLSKNNREAGDLRRYRAHYDITVMLWMEWIPSQWASYAEPRRFFIVRLRRLLIRHSIYRYIETPWHSCDVSVICVLSHNQAAHKITKLLKYWNRNNFHAIVIYCRYS